MKSDRSLVYRKEILGARRCYIYSPRDHIDASRSGTSEQLSVPDTADHLVYLSVSARGSEWLFGLAATPSASGKRGHRSLG